MAFVRSSGILLHPTSFPGTHGIGDLGPVAFDFIDYLVAAKQSLWQVLPLGPTGYGDSPYASFSSFAGNPLLINLDKLLALGDLDAKHLEQVPPFPQDKVDYGWVIEWKMPILEAAALRFLAQAEATRKRAYTTFCEENAAWLDDYALFMAVKEHYDDKAKRDDIFGAMWNNFWDEDIALGQAAAKERWRKQVAEAIEIHKVWQFYFFEQWGGSASICPSTSDSNCG